MLAPDARMGARRKNREESCERERARSQSESGIALAWLTGRSAQHKHRYKKNSAWAGRAMAQSCPQVAPPVLSSTFTLDLKSNEPASYLLQHDFYFPCSVLNVANTCSLCL
jgi:hypothetical protein